MDKFISEHLINKEVELDIGNKIITGKVISSADEVLTVIENGKYLFVNVQKILWIREK